MCFVIRCQSVLIPKLKTRPIKLKTWNGKIKVNRYVRIILSISNFMIPVTLLKA